MPATAGIFYFSRMKIFFSLLILIFPNLFFWIISYALDVDRAFFNLDYLLAIALISLKFSSIGVFLFVFAAIADLLTITSQIFVFANIEHLVYLSGFILNAPVQYKLTAVITLISISALTITISKTSKKASTLLCLAFLNIGIFIFYIEEKFNKPDLLSVRLVNNIIVDSPTLHNFETRTSAFFNSHNENENTLLRTNYTPAISEWNNRDNLPNKLFLIINESWGAHKNTNLQKLVEKPLTDLESTGLITIKNKGLLNFSGATVEAELKELCQLTTRNFNLAIIESGFDDCLPNQLSKKGYKTQSLHAASGILYDRINWYPKAGLNISEFFEDHSWKRRCFSYPGGCDFEAINFIEDVFNKNPKLFFYWLTLNSHAVYDKRDMIIEPFRCELFDIDNSSQTCRNLTLQNQFFTILSKSIVKGAFKGAEIIIVSDHPPIITNLDEKNQNFEDGLVPWIQFTVN